MVSLYAQIGDSSMPYRDVYRVQFGILSPDEIQRMSVTRPSIKYPDLFEKVKVKMQGLMDPQMGLVDRNAKCVTCTGSSIECPGHFGHIECQYVCFFLEIV